ncbi:MAG: tetratricopeptide repeat protein [Anaerolineae bacterium]|nr:tetratricopeptide repeat protein [Anaerolineae bacterium]
MSEDDYSDKLYGLNDFTFGEVLKELREDRDLSQEELGEKIGFTRVTINNWEGGKRLPRNSSVLEKVNIAIDLTPQDYHRLKKAFSYSHDMPPPPEAPAQSTQDKHINPRYLPQPVQHFVGREDEIDKIKKNLKPGRVMALWGHTGIGKTAIAAQVINELAPGEKLPEQFPDGIISYSFYGREGQNQADVALEFIVGSLNTALEGNLPPAAKAQLALAGKKVLLYLDGTENANNLEQVIRATDGRNNCIFITTTKKTQVQQYVSIEIDQLPLDEAINLLQKVSKPYAVVDATAKRIYSLVGGLTLALELAGRHLANFNEKEEVAEYLDWLKNLPFDALHISEHRLESVKALIKYSVDRLSEAAKLVLSTTGILSLEPISREVVATALAVTEDDTMQPLSELTNYSLLIKADNRYQIKHNLVYTYARQNENNLIDNRVVRKKLVKNLVTYYTKLAKEQSKLGSDGYARLDLERLHMMHLLEIIVVQKDWGNVLELVGSIDDYLDKQGHWTERVMALQDGLKAAKELEDRLSEAVNLNNLGLAYSDLGQVDKAFEHYQQALVIDRKIGDRHSEGIDLGNLGSVYHNLAQVDKAIEYYGQALVVAREIGNRRGESYALSNLGSAYHDRGQMEQAIEYRQQALKLAREIGDRQAESAVLSNLGNAYFDLGHVKQAIEYHEQALAIAREIGDRRGEGYHLGNLGVVYYDRGVTTYNSGDLELAIEYYEQALNINHETGNYQGVGAIFNNIGNVYRDLEQEEQAIKYYDEALAIARKVDDWRNVGDSLGNLGLVYYRQGVAYSNSDNLEQAIKYYDEAIAIARRLGDQRDEGTRLFNLGLIYRALGKVNQAIEYFEQALTIFEEIKSPELEQVNKLLKELDVEASD